MYLITGIDLCPCVQVQVKALFLHDWRDVLSPKDPEPPVQLWKAISRK